MALAKKVLRYLQGRKSIPLRWCDRSCQQSHLPGHIYGYADASFADIKPDRLSSMGYFFIINKGVAGGSGMKRSEEAGVSEEAVRRRGGGGGPRELGMSQGWRG